MAYYGGGMTRRHLFNYLTLLIGVACAVLATAAAVVAVVFASGGKNGNGLVFAIVLMVITLMMAPVSLTFIRSAVKRSI